MGDTGDDRMTRHRDRGPADHSSAIPTAVLTQNPAFADAHLSIVMPHSASEHTRPMGRRRQLCRTVTRPRRCHRPFGRSPVGDKLWCRHLFLSPAGEETHREDVDIYFPHPPAPTAKMSTCFWTLRPPASPRIPVHPASPGRTALQMPSATQSYRAVTPRHLISRCAKASPRCPAGDETRIPKRCRHLGITRGLQDVDIV